MVTAVQIASTADVASNNLQSSHKSRDALEDSEHMHQVVARSSLVPQQYYAKAIESKRKWTS